MQTVSLEDVLKLIAAKQPFEGVLDDGSLHLNIKEYVPCISTAIHHGHQFRDSLIPYCNINDEQRYHEEDAYTGDFIQLLPISLISLDSRFEYDLNREPDECIHEQAWGMQVWNQPLPDAEVNLTLSKHAQFYQVCDALVQCLLESTPNVAIVDVHSYNIQDRDYINPPMFNLGTAQVNVKKFRSTLDVYLTELAKIQISGEHVEAKENDVFHGLGYLAYFMQEKYDNVLVLPTEIKKIYADEFEPKPYESMIHTIRVGLTQAVQSTMLHLRQQP